MPRRYTRREKATAVLAADMLNVRAAAEQAGIPESTLRRWVDDPELADLRAKTREDLAAEAQVMAQLALAQIRRRLPEYEPRDLNVLYGIMVDKSQLLTGQATTRAETRALTDGMDDHERAALRAVLDGVLEGVEA